MQRNDWKFDYTAPQLAEATNDRIGFHDAQLTFWNAKREELLATIKSEGIEVNEKIVLGAFASPKSRDWDRGGEIMIRNDLRKGLQETFEKLAYHTKRRDTYDAWRQVLQANPQQRFALDIADWLFFFGRDVASDDADVEDILGARR